MSRSISDNLNRRAILAGVAAVPALAVPAAAGSPPLADSRLLELERRVNAAEAAAVEAGHIFTQAEEAMLAWRQHDPRPTAYAIAPDGATASISDWRELEKWKEAAQDALGRWARREEVARANCRYDELEAEYQRLLERADDLRAEAAQIVASSIEDLRCKVRMMSEADCLSFDGPLIESIVDDLRASPTANAARS
jgi:hypothetical protein